MSPLLGHRARSAAPLLCALLLGTSNARAIDPFEIQVYDGTANAPGAVGLELHLNRVFAGLRNAPAPELAPNHQTHLTLEPSLGIFAWWELGGYLQSTLRADGGFDYSGVKLRSKFVVPEGAYRALRLGLNLELSALPERYDAGRWAMEVRPIIAWENSRWLFAANPILGIGLTDLGGGPDLEPAAMAKLKLAEAYAVGIEYYASLGPIARLGSAEPRSHYLYETFDLLSVPHFELNFGVGEGLSRASNDLTLKLILGYTWD